MHILGDIGQGDKHSFKHSLYWIKIDLFQDYNSIMTFSLCKHVYVKVSLFKLVFMGSCHNMEKKTSGDLKYISKQKQINLNHKK